MQSIEQSTEVDCIDAATHGFLVFFQEHYHDEGEPKPTD